MKRIAIIGAGPMGLALAHYLMGKYHCTVFEADDRPGGMSASFDFDGRRIERYYHFINKPDEYTFSLLDELKIKHLLRWTPTKMGLYRKGRLHPWGNPLALLALNEIPFITRFRYGLHAFLCKFLKDLTPLDDVSASAWFKKWEGEEGYKVFWKFLFEKKFFDLADPLSAAWIASRIRRVANSRDSLMTESLGYIEGGTEVLIDALVQKLSQNGELRLRTPVTRIIPEKDGVDICFEGQQERFDAVISTVPLPYLPVLAPGLPKDYLSRVRQIKNIGCKCALFRLGKPVTENFWLNIDMPEWDIPGVIEYSNLNPLPASYVYIPFYMPQTHPNWQLSDEEILAKARSYLHALNPAAAESEEAARVFTYEYAQPVCTPGFRHILPPYATGAEHVWAADTTHSFPEDRSLNESIRIAKEIAAEVAEAL